MSPAALPLTAREGTFSRATNERTFALSFAARAPRRERLVLLGERVALWRVGPAAGEGPGLLGLHGLGSEGADLLAVASELEAPCVLLDLPGFGGSDRPDRAYPVARAAAVALALLDRLGWRRAVWLGASYGGHVALRAALDAPGRVAALALVASGGLDPAPDPALAALFDERRMRARTAGEVERATRALIAGPTALAEAFVSRRLARHGRPDVPGGSDYRAVARSAAGALVDGAGAALGRVAAPVELIHGERDALVPASLAEAAAARFPAAALTLLPGVGHLAWLEHPGAVAARVRRAIARTHS